MKSSVLLSLGCTLLLWACATASIAPSESQPSAQPTPQITPTPTLQSSFGPANPNNPCPDFHLTPQNLDLPVEKINNAPTELNAMCSSPSTGDLYLLTDTEVFRFGTNTQQAQKIFENPPDFKELMACTVDNQENIYLADQETEQLLQYHNTNKTWTELESRVNGSSLLRSSQYLSLHMSPKQELFILNPNGSRIRYYTQDLELRAFEISRNDFSMGGFNHELYRQQFVSEAINTIENTVMTTPLSFTFGPQQMFITVPSSWNEMFRVDLASEEVSPLPSMKQRGETAFIENSNILLSRSLFLTYSHRYKVIFQTIGADSPAWTSPETGCWQQLSRKITARDLTDGDDGHLYLIDSKTRGLHRIKLSPELFQPKTTD